MCASTLFNQCVTLGRLNRIISLHAKQCTGAHTYATTRRNKTVNIDRIKHILIGTSTKSVLVGPPSNCPALQRETNGNSQQIAAYSELMEVAILCKTIFHTRDTDTSRVFDLSQQIVTGIPFVGVSPSPRGVETSSYFVCLFVCLMVLRDTFPGDQFYWWRTRRKPPWLSGIRTRNVCWIYNYHPITTTTVICYIYGRYK